MAQEYQPRRFFRNAPNRLLQRYFAERNVLSEVDFGALTETQVEPIYEAWLKLSDDARKEMEQDFQDIDELATEGGSKAILDEARWHGEDLAEQFASLTGFHEHAFWTFLERPKYWQGALAFHHADTVPFSYWRKRKNVPRKPASVDALSIRQLEQNLSNYFHKMQGRGENCKVDCYNRNELDYFFAYPEDYAQARVEWVGKEFQRRPHHPAFEIIFVYSRNDGTLDIYLTGDRKPVPDLQAIFADTILKAELGPDEKDERVYDLNPVRSRQFQFVYGPEVGHRRRSREKAPAHRLRQEGAHRSGRRSHLQQACGLRSAGQGGKGNPVDANGGHSSRHQGDIRPQPHVEKTRHAGLRHRLAELVFSQARRARPHHPQDAGRLRHRTQGTGQRR